MEGAVTVVAVDVEAVDTSEDPLDVDFPVDLLVALEDPVKIRRSAPREAMVGEDTEAAITEEDIGVITVEEDIGVLPKAEAIMVVTVADPDGIMLRDITTVDTTTPEDTMEGTTGTIITGMPRMEQPLGSFSAG